MKLPRVYADFNNADPQGRLRLSCMGTFNSLSRQKMSLQEGAVMTFHDEDCEADGTVRYSDEERIWVGEIDWNAIRHQAGAYDEPLARATP